MPEVSHEEVVPASGTASGTTANSLAELIRKRTFLFCNLRLKVEARHLCWVWALYRQLGVTFFKNYEVLESFSVSHWF